MVVGLFSVNHLRRLCGHGLSPVGVELVTVMVTVMSVTVMMSVTVSR